jgi:hypothetical protein
MDLCSPIQGKVGKYFLKVTHVAVHDSKSTNQRYDFLVGTHNVLICHKQILACYRTSPNKTERRFQISETCEIAASRR